MNKNGCTLYPEAPNGGASRIFQKLLKLTQDRFITNYLYAAIMASDVNEKLDSQGFKRNVLGEHNIENILPLIGWDTINSDIGDLHKAEVEIGAVDHSGKRIDYTDALEAMLKVDAFNDSHKGLVATVIPHENTFNIVVYAKNSRTHLFGDSIKKKLKAWDIYKQVFNAKGIDIDNLPPELSSTFNAFNSHLGQRLLDIRNTDFKHLYKKEALILFSLDPQSRYS